MATKTTSHIKEKTQSILLENNFPTFFSSDKYFEATIIAIIKKNRSDKLGILKTLNKGKHLCKKGYTGHCKPRAITSPAAPMKTKLQSKKFFLRESPITKNKIVNMPI